MQASSFCYKFRTSSCNWRLGSYWYSVNCQLAIWY